MKCHIILFFCIVDRFTSSSSTQWELCAKEGKFCAFAVDSVVRFGLRDAHVYKTASPPGIDCTSTRIGADPMINFAKECWSTPASDSAALTLARTQFTSAKLQQPSSALPAHVGQQYVLNSYCIYDGIGSQLSRIMYPLIFSWYCPSFMPLFKSCDFKGHADRDYSKLCSVRVDQAHVDALLADPRGVLMQMLPFDANRPWRAQFEALECDKYQGASAVVFTEPPSFAKVHFEFDDRLAFAIPTLDVLPFPPPLAARCLLRVVAHFRAGDVFPGLHAQNQNVRGVEIAELRRILNVVRRRACATSVPVHIVVVTELSAANSVELSEQLGPVHILFASSDELVHIGAAAYADVLVLGLSSFSWFMSLFNRSALKIVSGNAEAQEKYAASPHYIDAANDFAAALDNLLERKRATLACLNVDAPECLCV